MASWSVRQSQCAELLERWPDLYDEPFGDPSGAPTHLVARIARRDVKVALSADGGDELFAGYTNYSKLPRLVERVSGIPRPARSGLKALLGEGSLRAGSSLARLMGGERNVKVVDRLSKLERVLPDVAPAQVFEAALSHWSPAEISGLLGRYTSPRRSASCYSGRFEEQMMQWDFDHYLPADILAKVDRATMAISLEGREPMLDHRLVQFAFDLPYEMRSGEMGSKHLLRKILFKYVPRELLDRPKQGFSIPLREWLLGELAELVGDYLAPERIESGGIFDAARVADTVRRFRRGDSIDATKIWLLVVFEMWRERWAA